MIRSVTCVRWPWLLLICALAGLLTEVRAADADADYVVLYRELRQAQQLEESGDAEQACAAFRAVRVRLKQFQGAYPSWHPEIVAFRLRTLESGIQRLCGPPTAEAPAPSATAAPEVSAEDLLRARLSQLELEREELKAKLREALAAHPGPTHSPELAQAEERVRTLEKEVALLRFANQTGSASAGAAPKSPPTDAEAALREQVQALQNALELERHKVAALEATASALGARLVQSRDTQPEEEPPGTPEQSAPSIRLEMSPATDLSDAASAEGSALVEGRALLQAGELDEAILVLGRGAQSPGASAELLSALGGAFLSKGLIEPAEAVARRALTADASCAEAHRVMARLCLLRKPPARSLARWHYQEARRHGLAPDPALEDLLSHAPTDPS
jgi:hypothetical protein